jgi:hypothetical protein
MEDPIRGSKDRPARHSRPMGCGLSHGRRGSTRSRRDRVRALGHVRAERPLIAPRYVHPPPSRLTPSGFDARRMHFPRNRHWATSPTGATYGEATGVASQPAGMHSVGAARYGHCSVRSPPSLRTAECSPLNAKVVLLATMFGQRHGGGFNQRSGSIPPLHRTSRSRSPSPGRPRCTDAQAVPATRARATAQGTSRKRRATRESPAPSMTRTLPGQSRGLWRLADPRVDRAVGEPGMSQ